MKDFYQTADWKKEKHVPVIDLSTRGDMKQVTVSVGKEIAHPNTSAHFIAWIEVYFHPKGEKNPYQIAKFDFTAHGASVDGADTSSVYTHPEGVCFFKTEKPGTVHASSYCNIHGMWSNSVEL